MLLNEWCCSTPLIFCNLPHIIPAGWKGSSLFIKSIEIHISWPRLTIFASLQHKLLSLIQFIIPYLVRLLDHTYTSLEPSTIVINYIHIFPETLFFCLFSYFWQLSLGLSNCLLNWASELNSLSLLPNNFHWSQNILHSNY